MRNLVDDLESCALIRELNLFLFGLVEHGIQQLLENPIWTEQGVCKRDATIVFKHLDVKKVVHMTKKQLDLASGMTDQSAGFIGKYHVA